MAAGWLWGTKREKTSGPCWMLKLRWMETQGVQMKRVFPRLVPWAWCAGTWEFCSVFSALVGQVQNIFFFTVHYFNFFAPIAHQAGQAAVLDRLLVCAEVESSSGTGMLIPSRTYISRNHPQQHCKTRFRLANVVLAYTMLKNRLCKHS